MLPDRLDLCLSPRSFPPFCKKELLCIFWSPGKKLIIVVQGIDVQSMGVPGAFFLTVLSHLNQLSQGSWLGPSIFSHTQEGHSDLCRHGRYQCDSHNSVLPLTHFSHWKLIVWQMGDRCGSGMDLGFGIGMCTLRNMEWLANRDLLYSTGHSTKYSLMVCVGKESEKEWMFVHFVVQQKSSQHCKSTILQ